MLRVATLTGGADTVAPQVGGDGEQAWLKDSSNGPFCLKRDRERELVDFFEFPMSPGQPRRLCTAESINAGLCLISQDDSAMTHCLALQTNPVEVLHFRMQNSP